MSDEGRERPAGPRCPTCDRAISWRGNPARPFCSPTCRTIDLARWLDGTFRVPGAPLSLPASTAPDETRAEAHADE